MKRQQKHSTINILFAIFMALFLCACSDDDDDRNVLLENYIVGSWHSYKTVVHANGETNTYKINKTGEFSFSYFEIDFKYDGTAILHGWVQDNMGLSHWGQGNCTYAVIGDEVRIRDSGGNSTSMFFDSKDRTLYTRGVVNNYGSTSTVYIYYRK